MNDTLKKLAGIFGSVAPTLATMLGGPLAGAAVSAIAGAFGLGDNASADDITKVVQTGGMTPEIMAAVRAADQKHAEAMAQQNIDLQKLKDDYETAMATTDAGDRDSARKREIAVKDNTPAALAWLVTLGFFGLLGFLCGGTPPAGSRDILNAMVGTLGTAWVAVMSYYFGSSRGSDRKTELMAQQPKT